MGSALWRRCLGGVAPVEEEVPPPGVVGGLLGVPGAAAEGVAGPGVAEVEHVSQLTKSSIFNF